MSHAPAGMDVNRLRELVGRELQSSWLEVSQEMIAGFADATGDRQWIHLDAARARVESPYGTTIAHGFLTLSLISRLLRDAIPFELAPRVAINYGVNKVRFPAPLTAGSRLRGRFTLARLEPVSGDAWQATWSAVLEKEGGDKPCCAAEWLVRYHP